jgi:MFS family permease
VLGLALATFFGFGLSLVLVGSHQVELATALSLDLTTTALLGASLALGAGLGITAAGPAYDRLPRRPLFAIAALVVGAALGSVDEDMTRWGAFARIVIAGVGGGAYNTLVNAEVSARHRKRAGRVLAVVHATATVGAMVGPVLFGALAARGGFVASFRALGAYHLILAVASLVVAWGQGRRVASSRDEPLRLLDLAPYLVLSGAYVAVEATATLFAVPRAQALGLDPERGRFAISAFWAGILASRIGLMSVARLAHPRVMVAAGFGAAAAAILPLMLAPRALELSFAAVGLFIGLVYPLTLALIGNRFAHARGVAMGLAGGAGAAGGLFGPWVAGLAGHALGTGASVALLGAFGLAVAAAGFSRAGRGDGGETR